MQHINSVSSLRSTIVEMEARQDEEEKALRAQFFLAYESIKPLNLIKSTFKEAAESQDLRKNVMNTAVGLAVGYFFKTTYMGVSHNPMKKILGNALLFGITNIVARNPEVVKSLAKSIFNLIRSKPRDDNRSGE